MEVLLLPRLLFSAEVCAGLWLEIFFLLDATHSVFLGWERKRQVDKAVHNCIAFQDISSGVGLNHKSLSDTPACELLSRGQYF